MNETSPPRRRARNRIAAATAAAFGAALLVSPGAAGAQDEAECAALGDNPMKSDIGAAFEAAVACGVEVRIKNRSYPYSTYRVTPEGQLKLTATGSPSQAFRDEGVPDPTLVDYYGSLVQDRSPWYLFLRYTDDYYPLIESHGGSTLDWKGEIPVPTYSGTEAVYDGLGDGVDLSVDVGVSSSEVRFDVANPSAWSELSNGLVVGYPETANVDGDIIEFHGSDDPFLSTERTTPFTVRTAGGNVERATLDLAADGTLTMSLPDGFLEDASFPMTVSTQLTLTDYGVGEWGAVTSASPDEALYRGGAGFDAPYFQAAGESGSAVVGEYCDALLGAGCTTSSDGAAYWNFQWPVSGRDRLPDYSFDYTFPVDSASFRVDAAAGTTCVAPPLHRTAEYTPAATWNTRPGPTGVPENGTCSEGTAVYDVTDLLPERWVDEDEDAADRITLGMPGSAETARFEGDTARFEIVFDIAGVYAYRHCSTDPDSPNTYGASDQEYGQIYVNAWKPDEIDLGLTFTATFRDAATGAAVLTTEPHDVVLENTSTRALDPADALESGSYEVTYELSSTTTGFNRTTGPCHMTVDTSE
ncbi:hypothetical protein [Glycomyces xiaoerkulensis]|uniref:hypothetical protein n=1 Tax=Glycomyces xiaoerkulensis TaxID=2038139 RepID=UPI000C25C0FA|nr:hypothetical protein [Glycomyces xiaoerkulensis]